MNVMAAAQSNFTAWDTAVQRVPKRTDIKTIMLLGAGPIVIGQVSCRGFESGGFEFEGWRVCLWEEEGEGKAQRERNGGCSSVLPRSLSSSSSPRLLNGTHEEGRKNQEEHEAVFGCSQTRQLTCCWYSDLL